MARIPFWAKLVFGGGCLGGGSVVLKEYLAGPPFEEDVDLQGKVAIVTGANRGIGFEVAKGLAARGAKVYLACRDRDSCAAAREEIFLDTDNKNVFCRYCDLASLDSLKRFVRRLQKDEPKVDLLINNAGIMWVDQTYTQDNIESQLAVNNMGHFFLTNLLIDKLKAGAPSRIVTLASSSHAKAKLNVKDLNSVEHYNSTTAYDQSQLANILFTRELARRLQGTDITANAVNPGVVSTELGKESLGSFSRFWLFITRPLYWAFIQAPRHGGQHVLHVALHPDLQNTSGKYFNRREIAEPSEEAQNDQLALWLWLASEKWTKLDSCRRELSVTPLIGQTEIGGGVSVPEKKQATVANVAKVVTQDVTSGLAANTVPS